MMSRPKLARSSYIYIKADCPRLAGSCTLGWRRATSSPISEAGSSFEADGSSGRKGGGEGQMMAQKGASCCSVQIYGFDGPKPYYDQWLGTAIRKMVQHARAVVSPASAGEKAVMELYKATTRRLTGKQPLHLEGRKIKEPAQHDDLPQLLREDLRVADDSHNVWGQLAGEDPEEDVESLAYSPDDGLPLDEAVVELRAGIAEHCFVQM